MVFRVPHEFRDGELAYAKQVNANFLAITDQIKELNTNKADVELSNISSSGISNIQKASLTRTIGEYVFSSIPLNNSSLHLLDGSLISGNGIYKQFVEYISDIYTNDSNYFISEADWQTSVNTYGVCAKFVYDSVNNTVRLPKVTGIVEGTTDINALGDLVEAGLPDISHTHTRGSMNITGSFTQTKLEAETIYGAFTYGTTGGTGSNCQAASGGGRRIDFNAANSWTGSTSTNTGISPIYGKSSTVQPQTIKALVYIVVATSQKTEVEIDIDQIATDLNGKMDKDCINCSANGYDLMAGASMPSDKYIDLAWGASGTEYVAPANGYYILIDRATAVGQMIACNVNYPDGTLAYGLVSASPTNYFQCKGLYPVLKGYRLLLGYSTVGTDFRLFRFVYAQGSESEVQ